MEVCKKQDELFVELRQRLQTGLIVIRSGDDGDRSKIKVSSGVSSLMIHLPAGVHEVTLPPNISLVDGSCQKNLDEDGLHIRIRLKVDECSEGPDSVIGRLRAQRKYGFQCQSCGSKLLRERVFSRVLPLPNGNWNALVDDWCCHPDPFANKKLHPKQEDCLLGDTYFLLTRDSSCDQSLRQELASDQRSGEGAGHRNGVVSCQTCSAVLGEAITTEVLKWYVTQVEVRPIEDGDGGVTRHSSRLQFLERTLASRLAELSSSQSIFRFSIQTPDGKAAVMLWLLNTDALIAVSADSSVSPTHPQSGARLSCQAVGAVKVLYLLCAAGEHQEAVDAWEKDLSVHPLVLPPTTCGEVTQLLNSSTLALPATLRAMDSYRVAYLKWL